MADNEKQVEEPTGELIEVRFGVPSSREALARAMEENNSRVTSSLKTDDSSGESDLKSTLTVVTTTPADRLPKLQVIETKETKPPEERTSNSVQELIGALLKLFRS